MELELGLPDLGTCRRLEEYKAGTAAVDTLVVRTVAAAYRTAAEQDNLELDNFDLHSLLDKVAVDILLVARTDLVVVHLMYGKNMV